MSDKRMLPDNLRSALQESIGLMWRDFMFSQRLINDYIACGVTIKGLEEMSDLELVEEYACSLWEPDPLLDQCLLEIQIHDIIASGGGESA